MLYVAQLNDHEVAVVRGATRSRHRQEATIEWMISETEIGAGYKGAVLLFGRSRNAESIDLISVARLRALKRGPYAAFRALHAFDSWRLPDSLPLTVILQTLSSVGDSFANLSAELSTLLQRDLPQQVTYGLDNQLKELFKPAVELLSKIEERERPEVRTQQPTEGNQQRTLERLDRLNTGFRLASVPKVRQVTVQNDTPPSADFIRFTAKQREHAMIDTDAIIPFPGWELSRTKAGWFEFLNGQRRLFVKNIDVEKLEVSTGGDLIYIRRNPSAAVVVQYKQLKRTQRSGWIFYNDGRLLRQLDTMIALSDKLIGGGQSALPTSDEYRLNNQFGYVKFIDERPVVPDDNQMLDGVYLPADYCRMLLKELEGKDGRWLTPFNPRKVRHFDATKFVHLVSDNWVGLMAGGAAEIDKVALPTSTDERTGDRTVIFDELCQ